MTGHDVILVVLEDAMWFVRHPGVTAGLLAGVVLLGVGLAAWDRR